MSIQLRRTTWEKRPAGVDVFLDGQRIAMVMPPSEVLRSPYWEAIGYARFPDAGTAKGFGQFLTRKDAVRAAVSWARAIEYAEKGR